MKLDKIDTEYGELNIMYDPVLSSVYPNTAVIIDLDELLLHFIEETKMDTNIQSDGYDGVVDTFLTELRNCGKLLQVTETGVILPDDKDVPFYEVVLESGTDDTYLVTGNIKHFPPEMFIVTPARFIEIVEMLAEI